MTNPSSTWTSPFDQALSAADAETPAITTPDPMIGTPGQDARDWAGQQHYQDDCAIRCQEYLITQFTGFPAA